MNEINKDLLEYIFLRVKDNDLINISLTCQKFRNIIKGKYFWMNKIIYRFPCLNYKLLKTDYKDYYFSLLDVFQEKNLHYISAMAQCYKQEDILNILSNYKKFQHSIPCLDYQDGKIISEFYISPYDNLEGKYIEYHENGRIKEVCFYNNNVKEGFCLIKDINGNIIEMGNYKNGKKHGNYRYYENNTIEINCNYIDNVLDGFFKTYINGRIFEETSYLKSIQHGKYKEYYDNGNIKTEGFYNKGNKEGIWVEYNAEGKIISEAEYKEDIFVYL